MRLKILFKTGDESIITPEADIDEICEMISGGNEKTKLMFKSKDDFFYCSLSDVAAITGTPDEDNTDGE